MIILHRGERIEALLLEGLRLFRLNVLGRSILLKPNLVRNAGSGEHELGSDRRRGARGPRTRARALLVMSATGSAPSALAPIECGIEGAEPAFLPDLVAR